MTITFGRGNSAISATIATGRSNTTYQQRGEAKAALCKLLGIAA